ncbi:MAG: metallophosphoesterase family protein [Candidatus Heimdallarchaeota archaeon]|nr:MAG: metallophosphoesterase family protein [Candidatus Heimdallarchaeota archaeon]
MPYTLAVISDIHANIVALDAVLHDIETQFPEITEYLCPGDLVGYGPDPTEVIDKILSEKFSAVTKGNHDHAIGGGGRDIANFNSYAQQAIKLHVKILTEEEKTFLYQLPSDRTVMYKKNEINIAIIHGSPQYPLDEYIRPNTAQQKDLFPFMELFELRILLLGHTHIPFIDTAKSESGQELLMCNPGSVGQPRDRDPRASYAVFDLDSFSAKIIRVDYDIDEVVKRIARVKLPEFLGDRLYEGR